MANETDKDRMAFLHVLAEASPMKTVYVTSQEELDAAVEAQKALGNRLAALSNTGCPPGTNRATFLPNSAFKDSAKGGGNGDA